MKKRLIALLTILVLAVAIMLPVYAEDDTTATEAVVETIETTAAVETTLTDEIPAEEEIAAADKQSFAEMLDGMSPEGVEKIKALILSGMDKIDSTENTGWDKAKTFILAHLTEVAWIVFAVVLVFYIAIEIIRYKGLRKSAATMNNNAILIAEKSTDAVKENTDVMKAVKDSVSQYQNTVSEAAELMKLQAAELERRNAEYEKMLIEYRVKLEINSRAETLLADSLNELLQLSNIPQIKKDAIYARYARAKALIESEMEDNSNDGESKENADENPS